MDVLPPDEALENFEVYFMQESTVSLGERPTVEKKLIWEQTCAAQ